METLWDKALSLVNQKINQQSFDTWFSPTSQCSYTEGILKIFVPSVFVAEWLSDNYSDIINDSIVELAQGTIEVEFIVKAAEEGRIIKKIPTEIQNKPTAIEKENILYTSNLNPRYTFDRFVVGPCNQFANAASLAVADQPAKAYNPLYIYGGVGLGKTHLLHAIGHAIKNKNSNLKICYKSSEEFTNELINAIRFDKMIPFRSKYRSVDVLLIDDVQFISGKERTQEEFFHTFNSLHEAHKQIVISSDCPPKDITNIEERLRSRFGWGLIADIQSPDLETRIAILKRKADGKGLSVPENVYFLIASNIASNIRDLEGALNKMIAHSSIHGCPINIDSAKVVLKDVLIEREKNITIDKIQKIVAEHYNLKASDLKSKVRTASLSLPRQIAMYLCRKHTNNSLPKIGDSFGGKDHTTVLHACNKIEKLINDDPSIKNIIQYLANQIHRL